MTQFKINDKKASQADFDTLAEHFQHEKENEITLDDVKRVCDYNRDDSLTLHDLAYFQYTPQLESLNLLLKKYGVHFEKPATFPDLSGSLGQFRDLEDLPNLIGDAEYLFLGESHVTFDEKYFVKLLEPLHLQGFKFLAIEMPSDFQDQIDMYLESGEKPNFNQVNTQRYFDNELIPLIEAAHQLGISIQCIDIPLTEGTGVVFDEKRDQYMADKLIGNATLGKTVIWIGAAHTYKDSDPYPTLRQHLDVKGLESYSVKIESKSSIYANWNVMLNSAFMIYSDFDESKTPKVYDAEIFRGVMFFDPLYSDGKYYLDYAEAVDSVVFLPE